MRNTLPAAMQSYLPAEILTPARLDDVAASLDWGARLALHDDVLIELTRDQSNTEARVAALETVLTSVLVFLRRHFPSDHIAEAGR